MRPLTAEDREALGAALTACGADGWLLFDFQGHNPVAGRFLGLGGLGSRRLFVLLTPVGDPVAVAHKIELGPLEDFPGRIVPYARREELAAALGELVGGKTVAMEISEQNGVPYLDRVPHGVVELIQALGGRVVSSASLVTRFVSRWSSEEAAQHVKAAEALARIAREALAFAVARGRTGLTESALQRRVMDAMAGEGIVPDHPPIVGFGPNAANPHYEPVQGRDRTLAPNEIVLLDLFGRYPGAISADQTWMGFSGPRPPDRVRTVWTVVRDARDAALDLIRQAAKRGDRLAGYQVDRAAREVIERAGLGEYFVHRTGHSIDQDLHGSGPHMDDYETRDDRIILPGCGFSVEPGVYLPGEFGVRSEVNVYWGPEGPVVTPAAIQRELITGEKASTVNGQRSTGTAP
ncbi:MAG TPA: Xaa-Pro peptidase family protein [Gemmatimonadales bacterium]|nr:Xaa-Pro peptidase family protein [Gemmatimonadales bacterium]